MDNASKDQENRNEDGEQDSIFRPPRLSFGARAEIPRAIAGAGSGSGKQLWLHVKLSGDEACIEA